MIRLGREAMNAARHFRQARSSTFDKSRTSAGAFVNHVGRSTTTRNPLLLFLLFGLFLLRTAQRCEPAPASSVVMTG